jgi:hypothetical protein
MLGEGMVSLGSAVVTAEARNRKWSPKMVSARCTRPVTSVPCAS